MATFACSARLREGLSLDTAHPLTNQLVDDVVGRMRCQSFISPARCLEACPRRGGMPRHDIVGHLAPAVSPPPRSVPLRRPQCHDCGLEPLRTKAAPNLTSRRRADLLLRGGLPSADTGRSIIQCRATAICGAASSSWISPGPPGALSGTLAAEDPASRRGLTATGRVARPVERLESNSIHQRPTSRDTPPESAGCQRVVLLAHGT